MGSISKSWTSFHPLVQMFPLSVIILLILTIAPVSGAEAGTHLDDINKMQGRSIGNLWAGKDF